MLIDDKHDMSSTQEVPPLLPALTSGRCRVKWTRLADLPTPLYGAYVAVHGHKIYVAGGDSPVEGAKHQVYVYDINLDQWGQLPPSGHYNGIPHIIGDKLAIIGGWLFATDKRTNKVSTFDDGSQAWTTYYPDLLSVRSLPGVVSHQEYVIVAGGISDVGIVRNDVEVLNWMEHSNWRTASIKLPVPMYEFTPIIPDDHLLIVGYAGADGNVKRAVYSLPVANITSSIDGQHNSPTSSRWTELTAVTHVFTALVPRSSPPAVIVGGWNNSDKTSTADIKMYDNSEHSWRSVGSLSSPKNFVAVAALDDNAIVVIGGCTKGGTNAERKSSSLTVVELGEAESLH